MKYLWILSLLLIFLLGLTSGYYLRPSITGFATVVEGKSTSLGELKFKNPKLGAVKGYLTFIIEDPYSGVVSKISATDVNIYAVRPEKNISDWGKVRATGAVIGTIENIDADDNIDKCLPNDYTTSEYFFDINDNLLKDSDEPILYQTKTDSQGCFALLLKPGNWDIYAY